MSDLNLTPAQLADGLVAVLEAERSRLAEALDIYRDALAVCEARLELARETRCAITSAEWLRDFADVAPALVAPTPLVRPQTPDTPLPPVEVPPPAATPERPAAADTASDPSPPPSDATPPKRRGRGPSAGARAPGRKELVAWDDIAGCITDARTGGRPITKAIVQRFRVSESTAKSWIRTCINRELVPPASKVSSGMSWDLPARPVGDEAEKVYRCECGEERATEDGLGTHTHKAHGRPPRTLELVLVAPRATSQVA